MYKGYGVHHVAIGVKDLDGMRSFYRDVLEFTDIFVDFPEAEYPALHEVARAAHPIYAAVLFSQAAGGIIVELVRMVDPDPRPIRKDFRYGDIGLTSLAIPVSDVDRFHKEFSGRVDFCSEPKSAVIPRWGDFRFVFCKDPEGNLIQFVSGASMPVDGRFGGVRWVGIGVTGLEQSIRFYEKYGGFDIVAVDAHEEFSGRVDEVSGAKQTRVRSCVLASSAAEGMVELIEVLEPRGRSIPFGVRWGDFGFLQVCLNGRQGDDVFLMAGEFEHEGVEFVSGPQLMGDERDGAFFYAKDPDGIPVEFLVFLK